jgi:hypothetical protein
MSVCFTTATRTRQKLKESRAKVARLQGDQDPNVSSSAVP